MSSTSVSYSQSALWPKSAFQVFLGSFLLAIFSNIQIPLPFTPVPVVVQNLLAIMLGIVLGPKKGSISVFLYLIQGAIGLPVFAGMSSGIACLLGPTGGYLIGYILSAWIAGNICKVKTGLSIWKSLLIGVSCQYLFGGLVFSFFVGLEKAFVLGVAPFIFIDIIKISIAAVSLKKIYKL